MYNIKIQLVSLMDEYHRNSWGLIIPMKIKVIILTFLNYVRMKGYQCRHLLLYQSQMKAFEQIEV